MRVVVLVVIFGCSSTSPTPTTTKHIEKSAGPRVCAVTTLGGWDGTPECEATARTAIMGADRVCESNADCIRIGPHCAPTAIRREKTDAYASVPCTDPASGQCPPPCAAVCRDGCCAIPPGWGDNCR